jgi:hypothetical protein
MNIYQIGSILARTPKTFIELIKHVPENTNLCRHISKLRVIEEISKNTTYELREEYLRNTYEQYGQSFYKFLMREELIVYLISSLRVKTYESDVYKFDKCLIGIACIMKNIGTIRYCITKQISCLDGMVIHGFLEGIKYAHENGCLWNILACHNASASGQLECLKYLHENGCPWNEETCYGAASHGYIECLKYAHENGCPWNEEICNIATLGEHSRNCLKFTPDGIKWDLETCRNDPTKCGHLECLKYAHENGCPWDTKIYYFAVCCRHMDCLKYACENDCPHNSWSGIVMWLSFTIATKIKRLGDSFRYALRHILG